MSNAAIDVPILNLLNKLFSGLRNSGDGFDIHGKRSTDGVETSTAFPALRWIVAGADASLNNFRDLNCPLIFLQEDLCFTSVVSIIRAKTYAEYEECEVEVPN